jgi:hypothetical protein
LVIFAFRANSLETMGIRSSVSESCLLLVRRTEHAGLRGRQEAR